jgi:predicted ATP-grasp superfamily ATP-dependent carboligase
MKVVEFAEKDLAEGLLLVGFPAQDVVGGIAANYLIRSLGLQLMGAVHDDDFPPSVAVQDDLGTSLVPVYAGELSGHGGAAVKLVVVKSDLALDPQFFAPLAQTLLDWAGKHGIRTVVSMEGVNVPERSLAPLAEHGHVQIFGLASLHGRGLLRSLSLPWLRHPTFTGFGAALLMKANATGQQAVCVFTSTSHDRADARAAARLLAALDPLLPRPPVEPAGLERKVEGLEAQIRLSNEEHLLALQRLGEGLSVMYV